jgi:hypothetical protein
VSFTEVAEKAKCLPRAERIRLIQELVGQLAGEEGIDGGEYPVWSPYESHDAADALLRKLEEEKTGAQAA